MLENRPCRGRATGERGEIPLPAPAHDASVPAAPHSRHCPAPRCRGICIAAKAARRERNQKLVIFLGELGQSAARYRRSRSAFIAFKHPRERPWLKPRQGRFADFLRCRKYVHIQRIQQFCSGIALVPSGANGPAPLRRSGSDLTVEPPSHAGQGHQGGFSGRGRRRSGLWLQQRLDAHGFILLLTVV